MKKYTYIFILPVITGLLQLTGCSDEKMPQRITEAFGVMTGIPNPQKKIFFSRAAQWHGINGEVEVYCTGKTYTVWKIDFVTAESSPAALRDAVRKQWHCELDSDARLTLPQSTITLLPEYRRGPSGMRISITDHAGAALEQQENAMPEIILARKQRRAVNDIMILEEALENYFTDTGSYPRILPELTENLLQHPKWDGPYAEKIPLDPWRNGYHYRAAPDGKSYELFSGGKNNRDKIR